jgi:hypothetical protein
VQVDPIKPTLKAPTTERLKLYNDELLSNAALKVNLRGYNTGYSSIALALALPPGGRLVVGRCRMTL